MIMLYRDIPVGSLFRVSRNSTILWRKDKGADYNIAENYEVGPEPPDSQVTVEIMGPKYPENAADKTHAAL